MRSAPDELSHLTSSRDETFGVLKHARLLEKALDRLFPCSAQTYAVGGACWFPTPERRTLQTSPDVTSSPFRLLFIRRVEGHDL